MDRIGDRIVLGARRAAAVVAALVAALSCGRRELTFADAQLAGRVYVSGPVVGAVVHAYRVDQGCTKGAALGASAPTGAEGSFTLDLGAEEGTVWLEVTGPGTYEELATGDQVALDPGVAVKGVVLDVQANELRSDVILSGLTSMAASLGCARHALGKDGGTLEEAFARAYGLVGAHFFEVDIGRTKVAELAGALTLTPEVRYALASAGLSQLARAMGDASVPRLSVNDANTLVLLRRLADDLESMEARFDGVARQGRLTLGLCDRPCTLTDQTVRTDLGKALLDFLNGPRNASGLKYNAASGRIMALVDDREPELFGGAVVGGPDAGPGGFDQTPPTITFVAPHDRDAVSGLVTLDVKAADATQVSTLLVQVGGLPAPDDQDATPERYLGTLDTRGFPDGPLTIVASALDPAGNRAEKTITVTVVNNGPGVITGVCVKGPLRGATVTASQYGNGTAGAQLGTTARTDDLGRFTLTGISGYSGAILVVCGGAGATYAEEAFTSTTVLGSRERLRTVLPGFTSNTVSLVVSPWTTLASAYLEYLIGRGQPLATAHPAAFGAIAGLLGVSDVERTVPALLDPTVTTFSEEGWTALSLAGLSQLAVAYATQGHVTPGTAVNGLIMTQRLEADLADGCLDGKDAQGAALFVGGVPLTRYALRDELAQAVAAYMTGSYNVSGLRSPRDAIDFLDHLAKNGPAVATTGCAPGQLFPDPGSAYDRVPPVITWDGATPPDGAYVRSPFTVKVTARDVITAAPVLRLVAPTTSGLIDDDQSASGVLVAVPERLQGDLTVAVEAEDGAQNKATAQRTFHVDNTGTLPIIQLAGVVRADGWTGQPVTVTVSAATAGARLVLVIDGREAPSGTVVASAGPHLVTATATDLAGTTKTATRAFIIDTLAPTLLLTGPVKPVRDRFPVTALLSDDRKDLGSLSPPEVDTLVVTGFTMAGTKPAVPLVAALGDGTVQLALQFVTTKENDGAVSLAFAGKDKAGNAVTASWLGTIDNTAPVVTIGLIPSLLDTNPWTRSDETVSVNVSEPGTTLDAKLDGLVIGAQTVVSTEGRHAVQASATDAAGNISNLAQTTFTIDKGAPTIQVVHVTPGAYIQGQLDLAAELDDAQRPLGSLQAPATFTASVSMTGGSISFADSTAVDGKRQLIGGVMTTGSNDGPVTVTFSGADRAGNSAAPVSWTGTIDNSPPTVSVTTGLPADRTVGPTAAPGGRLALAGTASDSVSGVAWVEVWRDGVIVVRAQGTTSWTASVTLTAGACPNGVGRNDFVLRAGDGAGNEVIAAPWTVFFDNCAPSIIVRNTQVYDEREFTADASAPCVALAGTTVATLCDTCGAPGVYKYAINLTRAAAACSGSSALTPNPIRALLDIHDNHAVNRVTAVVKGPGNVQGAARVDGATPGLSATHQIDVVTDDVPALALVEGTWSVQVTAEDDLGNQQTYTALSWSHHLIGGPVQIQGYEVQTSTVMPPGVVNPKLASLTANNLGTLTGGSPIAIYVFLLTNRTDRDTYMQMTPTSSVTFTRTVSQTSIFTGTAFGEGPNCADSKFSPATSSGECTTIPVDSVGTPQSLTIAPFVTGASAWVWSPVQLAYGPATAGPGPQEWLVPAHGRVDVFLLAGGPTFAQGLFDGGGADLAVTDGGLRTYYLFGTQLEFGVNDFVDADIQVYEFVRYLRDLLIVAASDKNFVGFASRVLPTSPLEKPAPLRPKPGFSLQQASATESPIP